MSRKRYVYTQPLFLKKVGTGTEYLKGELVKAGRVLVLTSVAVEDKTSALTSLRIGKISGGAFFPWQEQKTPQAAQLYWSDKEQWIREAEQFAVELIGGVAADACWAYLDGYWFYWNKKADK